MAFELEPIVALGAQPISEENPAGENIQDDLQFDQLQNDVQALIAGLGSAAEMEAIGDRKPATWKEIEARAQKMLAEKAKDIRLAGFLSIALLERHGFQGLNGAVRMLSALLENFWDTMFPPLKLIRGRTNTITFIVTNLAGENDEPGGRIKARQEALFDRWNDEGASSALLEEIVAEAEALESAEEANERLRELVYEKFPDDKLPSIASLKAAISRARYEMDEWVERNKPAEAQTATPGAAAGGGGGAAAAPTQARPAGQAAGGAPSTIESPDDARKLFGRMAPVLRQADLADPSSYRLNRWAAWGTLTTLPPTSDGQKTQVPDIQKPEVDNVQTLFNSGNWLQLINQSEERMGMTPLWLDRQFFVYQALGSLGPAYKPAQNAVKDELANLLRRLPTLPQLTFTGGMPFAGADTLAWIQSTVLAEGDGGGGGGVAMTTSAANEGDSELAEVMNKARQLARDGKLPEAMRLLGQGPQQHKSGRNRFLWRMAQAQIATEAGKGSQIIPFWEELVAAIDRHQLEEWEPDLCMTVFRSLYNLTRKDKERADVARTTFNRLCRLDPAAALEG